MERIHIHYGSWKSASTLIQMTLRQNKEVLADNGVAFIDQQTDQHKRFAGEFRKAVLAVQQEGVTSQDADAQCRYAARLFEELNTSFGLDTAVHSWENFVGHPLFNTQRTLYHGVFTAWWFETYLSNLPLEFTFITRNQADLIEAMYTQEVRKGRFLSSIDDFLEKFVKGRDLSWLSVVEPFFARFGSEKVRVIPFEEIKKEGSEGFLKSFFSPFLEFDLELKVDHSNPSFSGKAVEVALKTYPGLTEEQRQREEKRLVREYSNLKYPRSDFLGKERRSLLLESVSKDNKLLFDNFISSQYKGSQKEYSPLLSKQKGGGDGWVSSFYQSSRKKKAEKVADLHLVDFNGGEKKIPFIKVEGDLKSFLPEKYSGETVLISQWAFNYTVPKGGMVNVRLEIPGNDQFLELNDVSLDLVELIGSDEVGDVFTLHPEHDRFASLTKGNAQVRYAAVLTSKEPGLDLKEGVKIEPCKNQLLPSHIEFDVDGLVPCQGKMVLPGYSKKLRSFPCKINSLESLSIFEKKEPLSEEGSLEPRPFFLTIDTESFYFKRPTMMTGEGLKGAKASYEILDELDKNKLKAVFYVNVYEHLQYGDDSLERLCKTIYERGHEVALHSHKSAELDFYNKEIVNYDYDGQRRILEYGKELLQKWLNYEVVNFRAGGYQHNDDTLKALQDLDFKIDSSYFYRHSNARQHSGRYVEPYKIGSLIEVPVLHLPLVMPDGSISDRKFDINSVNLSELQAVVGRGAEGLSVFSYMMHSFSFIERKRFESSQRPEKLLMKSSPLNSRGNYIGVTGLYDNLWNDFCKFLDWLSSNKSLSVKTMCSSIDELTMLVESHKERGVSPILYR